jgi:uncharacterized protein YgiM (DUF1202 family)
MITRILKYVAIILLLGVSISLARSTVQNNFVSAQIPTPTAAPTSTTALLPTPTARVCTVIDLYGDGSTTVNVRGRATMDSPVVDVVSGWDELTIYSRSDDWLGVITPNGVAGWVYSKWCEVEQ